MTTFVVVYASRIENGLPCPDACGRCDVAITVAREKNAFIVIGVGSPPNESHRLFSQAMVRYLVEHGWPEYRIIINPVGWSTINESKAAYEAIKHAGDGAIIVVSAWYHIFRVWLIWLLGLKRVVKIRFSWKTYPWTNPFREIVALVFTLYRLALSK